MLLHIALLWLTPFYLFYSVFNSYLYATLLIIQLARGSLDDSLPLTHSRFEQNFASFLWHLSFSLFSLPGNGSFLVVLVRFLFYFLFFFLLIFFLFFCFCFFLFLLSVPLSVGDMPYSLSFLALISFVVPSPMVEVLISVKIFFCCLFVYLVFLFVILCVGQRSFMNPRFFLFVSFPVKNSAFNQRVA